jgi:L-aminopeptidase/D-esterase-like protein
MEHIDINDIAAACGIRIGQTEDADGGTGATVIIAPEGMGASISVRGGGPASRDTRILDPLMAAECIHAVLLAGGSAFGLDATGGVQRYLAEHGIGLPVGDAMVPLVCQSDIFDLLVGSIGARPNAAMGYAACQAAEAGASGNYRDGNLGAGCGATVGKAAGGEFCMKSGIGSSVLKLGPLMVGAIVVVNALGDVHDPATGRTIAGCLAPDHRGFRRTEDVLYAAYENRMAQHDEASDEATGDTGETSGTGAGTNPGNLVTNTTIGAIITNADLSKAALAKVADMAHDGIARTISPVHTAMDGDSIYALSAGRADTKVATDIDTVGIAAADAMAQAVLVAARSAAPAFGLPCASSLQVNHS